MSLRNGPDSSCRFVEEGLARLESTDPDSYARATVQLADLPANYRIGAESFSVRVVDRCIVAGEALHDVRVTVEVAPDDVVRLVDGGVSAQELLRSERLQVWGEADALLGLSAAIRMIGRTAIRGTSLRNLFEDYRSWVAGAGDHQQG